MSSSPIPLPAAAPTSLKVMTVNTHKGFTALNRRFILPELRDAVRTVGADVVFLQEVLGTHSRHSRKVNNWPEAPHYEFLADTMWPQFAYGRNAVYPRGHHGNAVLSKFPIVHYRNHDVSVAGPEKRGLLHCVLRLPGRTVDVHAICAHLGLAETHRQQQLELLCHIVRDEVPPDAPLVVAGDFNDWRGRAHRVLEEISVTLSAAVARSHLCAQRRRARAGGTAAQALVAPVGPCAAGGKHRPLNMDYAHVPRSSFPRAATPIACTAGH
jgi:endonuclease/exonuclease/phosphatase family metal-dependent hydrolase